MSNWINADGNIEKSASNLALSHQIDAARNEMGGTSYETSGTDFNVYVGAEQQTHLDDGYQGSVIGSAMTEGGGMIVNRSVRASDRVTLPEGIATSVAVATNLGYLIRNPDGTFSDVPQQEPLKNPAEEAVKAAPAGATEDKTEGATEQGADLGEEGTAAFKAITENVMPGDAIKAMDEIFQLGEVSENTLGRMASMASKEPGEMAEMVNAVHQGFYDAASAHMAKFGVTDGDAFVGFLGANPDQARMFGDAARAWVMNGETRGMDDVASSFMEQADQFIGDDVRNALDEAGYEYQDGPNGRLMVIIDGALVPWNVAVRQQIIRFI